jgi:hypothetical protein
VVGLHRFAWDLFLPLLRILGAIEWEYSKADLLASPKLQDAVVGYWQPSKIQRIPEPGVQIPRSGQRITSLMESPTAQS